MSPYLISAGRHVRGKAVVVALAGALGVIMLGDLAQRALISAASAVVTVVVVTLAATIALLLAHAATRPGRFQVQRAQTIATSVERVVPFINDLRRLDSGSPLVMVDPTSGKSVSSRGTRYRLAASETGRIEIVDADPLSGFVVRLVLAEPLAIRSRLALTLEPQGDTIRVTWATAGEVSLLGKALRLFFDVDALIGRTFEAYLADLKMMVE